jgi:hypothetical protein
MNQDQTYSGSLQKLLPIRFSGGFVLEALAEDCVRCGQPIAIASWQAEAHWITPRSCVISMASSCPECASAQARRVRIRAQNGQWAYVDWSVDDQWQTAVVGNVTLIQRIRLAAGF